MMNFRLSTEKTRRLLDAIFDLRNVGRRDE